MKFAPLPPSEYWTMLKGWIGEKKKKKKEKKLTAYATVQLFLLFLRVNLSLIEDKSFFQFRFNYISRNTFYDRMC